MPSIPNDSSCCGCESLRLPGGVAVCSTDHVSGLPLPMREMAEFIHPPCWHERLVLNEESRAVEFEYRTTQGLIPSDSCGTLRFVDPVVPGGKGWEYLETNPVIGPESSYLVWSWKRIKPHENGEWYAELSARRHSPAQQLGPFETREEAISAGKNYTGTTVVVTGWRLDPRNKTLFEIEVIEVIQDDAE